MSKAFVARGTVIAFRTDPSASYSELAEIKSIDFSGSKYDLDDVTNYESGNFREWITTLADSGELSFTGNYIPSDVSQQSLRGFFNNGTLVAWQITLPAEADADDPITFDAYVSSQDVNLPLDKAASITGKLKITGRISGI